MIMLINFLTSLIIIKPAANVNLSQYGYLPLNREKRELVGFSFKDRQKKYLNLDKYQTLALKIQVKASKVKMASSKKFSPGLKKRPLALVPLRLEPLFDQYSQQYKVSKSLLKKIARCESGFNSRAVNGPYGGMYQFLTTTWQSNRRAMGLNPHPDLRFNANEAIKTTAFKIARDGTGAWPVCGR